MPWEGTGGLADLAAVAVRDTFGETAVYTAPGGSAESVMAPFDAGFASIQIVDGVGVDSIDPVVDVRLADLAAAPVQRATVVVAGTTYEVVRVERDDARVSAKLFLKRPV